MTEKLVDRAGLAAAMLAMATARSSRCLVVSGEASGRIWFRDGDIVFAATTTDGGDAEDLDDPVFRAHRAISTTLRALSSNLIMTVSVQESLAAGSPEDPRFDTLHLILEMDPMPAAAAV